MTKNRIREVIEDVKRSKNKMLPYACADLLTAIIAEMEKDMNNPELQELDLEGMRSYKTALREQIAKLTEALDSLYPSSNTDE